MLTWRIGPRYKKMMLARRCIMNNEKNLLQLIPHKITNTSLSHYCPTKLQCGHLLGSMVGHSAKSPMFTTVRIEIGRQ